VLLAEIHGKTVEVARDNEDYLTSTVFGHLRYVAPGLFWDDLMKRARGVPDSGGHEPLLGELLADTGRLPSAYSRLKVLFWKKHEIHGEPDLILVFTAEGLPPLVILVEAKLWSGKSGTGDRDQLVRYLRVLEDLGGIGMVTEALAPRYLIYLTPGESLAEVEDSAALADGLLKDGPRLFRLQWQDVLEAAEAAGAGSCEPTCTVLPDVARFLQELGLEYFKGMHCLGELHVLMPGLGAFYEVGQTGFCEMTQETRLGYFEVCKGAWT